MPYRFQRAEPVEEAIRRIAVEQLTSAIEDANGPDVDKAVHDVRKRCKKIRGLLRLIRKHFDAYESENAAIRDTARLLSRSRDAAVRLAAFEQLTEHFHLDGGAMAPLHDWLRAERDETIGGPIDARQVLAEVIDRLSQARHRAEAWPIGPPGFHAISDGLQNEYSASKRAMRRAADVPDIEAHHNWRRHAKYHWHHMSLLRRIWRNEMNVRRDAALSLSDMLGDDHDLALLARHLAPRADERATQLVLHHLDDRRATLHRKAHHLGDLLFAEKPRRFTERIRVYWHSWMEK